MSDKQIKRHLDAASLLVDSGYRDVARLVLDVVMRDMGSGDGGDEGESGEGSAAADPILELTSPGPADRKCDECGRGLRWDNRSGICHKCRIKGVLKRRERGGPRLCPGCGSPAEGRWKYCEVCRRERERERAREKVCGICGKPVGKGRIKYCGDECGKRGELARKGKVPASERACVVCGDGLGRGRSKYCSDTCVGEAEREYERARYRRVRDENVAAGRRVTAGWNKHRLGERVVRERGWSYARELHFQAQEQAALDAELAELGWEFSVSLDQWVKVNGVNGHKEGVHV